LALKHNDKYQLEKLFYEYYAVLLLYSISIVREKDDAEEIITELFSFWITNPLALPHNYHEKAQTEALPRVVCDYIAGMTDHFIIEQYEKYCGRN